MIPFVDYKQEDLTFHEVRLTKRQIKKGEKKTIERGTGHLVQKLLTELQ